MSPVGFKEGAASIMKGFHVPPMIQAILDKAGDAPQDQVRAALEIQRTVRSELPRGVILGTAALNSSGI